MKLVQKQQQQRDLIRKNRKEKQVNITTYNYNY